MAAPIDVESISRQLDEQGWALTPKLLTAADGRELAAGFDDDARYRSTIDMRRHGFGSGTYRYFGEPLPAVVRRLRASLYPPLAEIANAWSDRLGDPTRYPATLDELQRRCAANDQARPTPLVFRYEAGDYNALHQDVYGPVRFPLQAVTVLDRPERDFTGGELVLVTQIPRRQSVAEVVPLERGRFVVFPNASRPMAGRRGWFTANVRHGVSTVRSGRRHTLGIIFHDAR